MKSEIHPTSEMAPTSGAEIGRRSAAETRAHISRSKALVVATGILLSRIAGLIREAIFAHFFGNSDAADAFKAAARIPNILQNLFGEGVLSASFIPVYSKLLAGGDETLANRLAWTVGAVLGLVVSILTLLGVIATPYLIDLIAPGFHGGKRTLTILLVRIFFPGAGLLTMSAWCLGVLNSHRRFFASYAAPVAWNLAIIAALLFYGPSRSEPRLAVLAAWGAVAGAGLQILVQLPQTLMLAGRLRVDLARTREALRAVISNFMPVVAGRGAAQISGYVDNLLASLLPTGAVAALNYAQILYMMPLSLFGMSVAAAELPDMSKARGTAEEIGGILAARLNTGLRQIAFLVVPSVAVFLLLGDVLAGLIFQSGRFGHGDALYVWAVLAGSGVGLLATTMGRLYNSAFYALWDTRTPLKFALIRIALTLILGYVSALWLPQWVGIAPRWGVAGLTASAGVAGWVEFSLLRSNLNSRVGWTGLERAFLKRLWLIALIAAALGLGAKVVVAGGGPRLTGMIVLSVFGLAYLAIAYASGVEELRWMADRLVRRFRGRMGSA